MAALLLALFAQISLEIGTGLWYDTKSGKIRRANKRPESMRLKAWNWQEGRCI
jgi:hypothetical protein